MKYSKRERAEYLYSEMSGISDEFINEALSYRKKKSLKPFFFASAAAAVALLFAIAAPWMFLKDHKTETMSFYLSIKNTEGMTVSDVSEIVFFDGGVKLIISDEENGGYKLLSLPHASSSTIIEIMSENHVKPLEEDPDSIPRIWISLGDGRTVSPYLEYSAGNTGACELFGYEPEGEPSTKLTEYISGLLS